MCRPVCFVLVVIVCVSLPLQAQDQSWYAECPPCRAHLGGSGKMSPARRTLRIPGLVLCLQWKTNADDHHENKADRAAHRMPSLRFHQGNPCLMWVGDLVRTIPPAMTGCQTIQAIGESGEIAPAP